MEIAKIFPNDVEHMWNLFENTQNIISFYSSLDKKNKNILCGYVSKNL